MSAEVATRDKDCLSSKVEALKKKNVEMAYAMVESKIDQECIDEYIDHLAFQLEPFLSLYPPEVADEIQNMPNDIRVHVTLTDHRVSKEVEAAADATDAIPDV